MMSASSPSPAATDALVSLLSGTMSAHQETRLASEKNLAHVAVQPGFLPALLSVVSGNNNNNNNVEQPLRKAAAIYCKNEVEKRWVLEQADGDRAAIAPQDKQAVREMVVPALVNACQSSSGLVPLLKATIHRMVRQDFPKNWPGLLDQVVPLLQTSTDMAVLQAGLIVLHEIVSWKGYDDDQIAQQIYSSFCPQLLTIAQSVLPSAGESDQAALILKHVLKTIYACISYKYNPAVLGEHSAVPWITVITQTLQVAIPDRLKAKLKDMEDEEKAELPLFKAKKWALHCQIRIFQRHGCPDGSSFQPPTGNHSWSFSKFYMANMVQPVVSVIMAMVSQWSDLTGTDRLFCLLCDFVSEMIRNKRLFDALLPHLPTILNTFAFPKLCFSEQDQQQWEDDPMEYVRSMLDPFDDYYSPAANAANLFLDLSKSRKKHVFPVVLHQISAIMNDATADPRKRDGCFFLVGTLAKMLVKNNMTEAVEQLVTVHILPCLMNTQQSPAFLRVRALWTIQQFSDLTYKNQDTVLSLLRAILAGLHDTANLPVQVQSACTLGDMLDQQAIQQALPQVLAPVVETVLSLNSRCENDSLAMVLEKLVSMFASELAPFAVQLCASLRDTAVRISGQAQVDVESGFADFEDNGPMMALVGMMRTIVTLVDSMADSPQLLAALEETVCPLLVFLLEHKLHDVYDEVFELVESFTYLRKAVSPSAWRVIEHLVLVLVPACDLDYIDEVAVVVDNAVTYDPTTFWSNHRILSAVMDIAKRVMTMPEDDAFGYTNEIESVLEMMEAVLLSSSSGQVPADNLQQVAQMFVMLAMRKVAEEKCDTDTMTVLHLEVVLAGLIADARSVVLLLDSQNWSDAFLAKLSLLSSKFTRVHDKRLLIAAVSAIITKLQLAELPSSFKRHLHILLAVYADAIKTLPAAMAERKRLQDEADNDDDDQEDGDYDDFDYASDDYEDLDALEERRSSSPQHQQQQSDSVDYDNLDEDENYSDDGEWEEEALEENIYYESALDKVDMAALVQSSLVQVARHQAAALQAALGGLSAEHQQLLLSIIQ